jgi:ABC-type multidrug transport system permease subunit
VTPRSNCLTSFGLGGPLAALTHRDYAVFRSYRLSLAFDLLYGVVDLFIYFFISKTFKGASTTSLGGAPTYFAFVTVGIVGTLVVSAASGQVGWRIREEQLIGTLETLAAQPVRAWQIALGMAGWPFAFAFARAALYLTIGAAFLDVDVSRANWGGVALVLVAASLALLAVGVALAALVVAFKRGNNILGVLSLGLGFAGGAFFPLAVLPGWLEFIGKLLPTRFVFDGARAALFRGSGWGEDAAVLLGYGAIALPLALWVFSLAFAHAKQLGALAEY